MDKKSKLIKMYEDEKNENMLKILNKDFNDEKARKLAFKNATAAVFRFVLITDPGSNISKFQHRCRFQSRWLRAVSRGNLWHPADMSG